MIYYPVFGAFPSFFGGSMDDYLRDTVSIRKDVEGLSNTYRRNLYHNVRYTYATMAVDGPPCKRRVLSRPRPSPLCVSRCVVFI